MPCTDFALSHKNTHRLRLVAQRKKSVSFYVSAVSFLLLPLSGCNENETADKKLSRTTNNKPTPQARTYTRRDAHSADLFGAGLSKTQEENAHCSPLDPRGVIVGSMLERMLEVLSVVTGDLELFAIFTMLGCQV